jgi:hypothetical protein
MTVSLVKERATCSSKVVTWLIGNLRSTEIVGCALNVGPRQMEPHRKLPDETTFRLWAHLLQCTSHHTRKAS